MVIPRIRLYFLFVHYFGAFILRPPSSPRSASLLYPKGEGGQELRNSAPLDKFAQMF
jgi:hypothetical protein